MKLIRYDSDMLACYITFNLFIYICIFSFQQLYHLLFLVEVAHMAATFSIK